MLQLNFTPFPVLSTERLILRKLKEEDVDEIFIQRSHPTIQKFIKRTPAANKEDALEWIKKVTQLEADNESINWVIVPKGENKLIGCICLWNIEKELERAEAGYSLHPDYFGKGIMSEALAAITKYGFETMKLARIDAYTNKDNLASLALLKKNNFERNFDFEKDFEDKEELEYNVIYSRLKK